MTGRRNNGWRNMKEVEEEEEERRKEKKSKRRKRWRRGATSRHIFFSPLIGARTFLRDVTTQLRLRVALLCFPLASDSSLP